MPINIDLDYLYTNKALKEADFNKFIRQLQKVFSSDDFRISSIRKSWADLIPVEYPEYLDLQRSFPLIDESESFGEDLLIEIDNILIQFKTTFNSSFFPNFENEYFSPFIGIGVENSQVEDDLKLLDNSQYHSTLLASYEFETKLKEMLGDEYSVVVVIEFLVPSFIDGTFDITMKVNISVLL